MIFRSRPLHTSADVDIKIWPCLGHYVLGKTAEVVDIVEFHVDSFIWQFIRGNYTLRPSADVWDYFHSGLEKTTASHWLLPSCPSFSSHARQCAAIATIDENPEECWPHAGKENHRVSSLRRQLESHVLYSMKLHHFVRHRLAQNISTNNNIHCALSNLYYIDKCFLVSLQCTMVPLSTRSCLKSNKLRPILNAQFCHEISKNICLNVFGSKQPREILFFFVIFEL